MLIDKSHIPWILGSAAVGVVASAVYVGIDRHTPGGLTGGSVAGLWLGIAGAALLVYAALLSALRRFPDRRRMASRPVGIAAAVAIALVGAMLLLRRVGSGGIGPARPILDILLILGIVGAVLSGLVRIGLRQTWMRGHIWLGTLGAWLLLLHGGFRWGGPLERALWVVLALTVLTGFYGLALQHILPRLMAARFPREVPFEQVPHVCGLLRMRADELVDTSCGAFAAVAPGADRASAGPDPDGESRRQFRTLYEREVRPFLDAPYRRSRRLANPREAEALFDEIRQQAWPSDDHDRLSELEELCTKRRRVGEQERLHRLLHAWLFAHIPLSVALLALGAIHAVMSLYY